MAYQRSGNKRGCGVATMAAAVAAAKRVTVAATACDVAVAFNWWRYQHAWLWRGVTIGHRRGSS